MREPALILNPRARKLQRRPELIDEVRRRTRGRADVFVPTTFAELDSVAQTILEKGAPIVLIAGGDGTYMAGVSALSRAARGRGIPRIVLAPAGTVATVARNFGQRLGLLETVERVCADRVGKADNPRPTLRVNDGAEERVGFTVGTGLVARFFEKYEAAGAPGYGGAFNIVLRIFVGSFRNDAYARSVLEPLPCRIVADGHELEPKAFSLVICSVLRDLGLHMLVTYRAAENPLRPQLVASPLPPARLGPQWPRVALGLPLTGPENFDALVESFTIDFGDFGPYVLDGDTLRAKKITVSAGPLIRVVTY